MGEITKEMDAALRSCSHLVSTISAERIRDEFLKGVDSAKSVIDFLSMIDRYGLFKDVFPGAAINRKFVEERDHAVLMACLLVENGIDRSGEIMQAAKYTLQEIKTVKFLIALKDLTVQSAFLLKKAEGNVRIYPDQMMAFASYVKIDKRLIEAFLEFKLSVTGDDLAGKVKPGPEMGTMIRSMETKKFEDLLG